MSSNNNNNRVGHVPFSSNDNCQSLSREAEMNCKPSLTADSMVGKDTSCFRGNTNNNSIMLPSDGSSQAIQSETMNINKLLRVDNVRQNSIEFQLQNADASRNQASLSRDHLPFSGVGIQAQGQAQAQQVNNFLSQLSQAAAQRLHEDAKRSGNGNTDGSGNHESPKSSNLKKRDLESDVLGNCLHSNAQTSKISERAQSPSSKNNSSCNNNKKDKSNLRKGKWTVS